MESVRGKRISVLLYDTQIDFLRNLAKRIEEEGPKKMSRSQIVKVLTKILTCMKPEIRECRSEKEIEKELIRCLKQALKELER